MFTQQVDLCRRIVRDHFGPIVETIASVLIREGRLHLGLIIRNSGLSPLNVRQSLAVLIQHSIVTHAETKEGTRSLTFYSISIKSILRLKRVGLYLGLVEERIGKDGLAIFRTIMANGVMSIASVRESLGIKKTAKTPASIKFDNTVARLVKERFIIAVTPKDTITKIDRMMQEEARMTDALQLPPTGKELMEIRRKIKEQEDEEYYSNAIVGFKHSASQPSSSSATTNNKRPAPSIALNPIQKVHIEYDANGRPMGIVTAGSLVSSSNTNGTTNGSQMEEPESEPVADAVDDKLCFRPYHDRLDVLLRNQQIINLFADKYNAGAGAVVKSILRVTEPRTRTCRDKVSEVVSANQIIHHIPIDAPLADAVDTGSDMFYKKLNSIDEPTSPDDNAHMSQARRNEIAFALLEVIHKDSSGIITKVEERGAGQYRVNFERAAAILRDNALDSLIQEKFGALNARIVRVLRDKQKLDEKTVSQAAMLPVAMCRERLHDLALSGLIDTLEIPRTADRNPSRMFYLWFVNPDKQMRSAMGYIFQGISNLQQRIDHELSLRSALVTKSKRKDVIADPSLLTDMEHKEIQNLAAIKQKLEVAIIRLDSMLLVVHDINPSSSDLQLLQ
ncbi:RNA polymerase III subunit C82 [Coemansia asiatica]|nr:RNA polymerase III subunit C82 [Coemansia asiatica]